MENNREQLQGIKKDKEEKQMSIMDEIYEIEEQEERYREYEYELVGKTCFDILNSNDEDLVTFLNCAC